MKIEKLNPEQKELLKINKDKFVKKFLNSDKIDDKNAEEAIKFVYSLIKKEMPKIYKSTNPLEAQRLANKLKGTEKEFYQFGTYLSIYWASFYAYYETFVDLGIITEDKFPKYFELRKFIDSNIFTTIEFEKAIIIVEKPMICLKNENGLHNLDGKAIQWEDGYGQYYVNGRCISEKYFNSITNKTFTMNDFITEENEENKSTCVAFIQAKHGEEYLFNFFRENLNEVNTFVDKKEEQYLEGTTGGMNVGVYTLFKGQINEEDIAYVRCYCPSTDRMFFLGVDPINNNAKDSIASLYRVPKKLVREIVSINRQGELFSTNFTEKGLSLLKEMKEEDIRDTVSISGEDYFKFIKFEY